MRTSLRVLRKLLRLASSKNGLDFAGKIDIVMIEKGLPLGNLFSIIRGELCLSISIWKLYRGVC